MTGISLFVLSTRQIRFPQGFLQYMCSAAGLPEHYRRALPCACCAPRPLQLHPRAAAKFASNQCPASATGKRSKNSASATAIYSAMQAEKPSVPDQVHFSIMSSVLALAKLAVSGRRAEHNATSTHHVDNVGAVAMQAVARTCHPCPLVFCCCSLPLPEAPHLSHRSIFTTITSLTSFNQKRCL
jgi:hypothetical protein